jgi:hypothetical protein
MAPSSSVVIIVPRHRHVAICRAGRDRAVGRLSGYYAIRRNWLIIRIRFADIDDLASLHDPLLLLDTVWAIHDLMVVALAGTIRRATTASDQRTGTGAYQHP